MWQLSAGIQRDTTSMTINVNDELQYEVLAHELLSMVLHSVLGFLRLINGLM